MKLVSFRLGEQATYGIEVSDQYLRPAVHFLKQYPDLVSVLAANAQEELERSALDSALVVNPAQITALPVLPNPRKIICVGLNYKSHVAETKREDSKYPALFIRFADSLAANHDEVLRPQFSVCLDWEGELAVVIGRGGRNISQVRAFDHVAGYACFNDITVRDWQRHTQQWTPGKNFPGTGPFGPWLVTVNDVPDVGALTLETRLNGQTMQHAPLSDLIFTIPVLIEYISRFTPLSAGDVIATGTPGGVGDRRSPPIYMKDGDITEVEITGLGLLTNRIGTEP